MVGLSIKNQESISPAYACRTCNLILRDPCQLNCGHRQCKSCIDSVQEEVVRCSECNEETNKVDIMPDRGFRNDMKKLPIACSSCGWDGLFKEYEDHLAREHANPLCHFCGAKFASMDQFEVHKQRECTKITVPCALKEYGCSESVVQVKMHEHLLTTTHQTVLLNCLLRTTHKRTAGWHEESRDMANSLESIFLSNTTAAKHPLEQEKINALTNTLQTLTDDLQRMRSDLNRAQNSIGSLTQDLSALQLGIQERNALLEGMQLNQDIIQQEVASLKRRLDEQRNVSYDGTLTWKITSIRDKMEDARSERQTSIYSPPFYSSPTGYKMRARLYPNGDGRAKGTHMSIFFVLMQSSYDAIIPFPFSYTIAFCLFNQTDPQRHIIDSFRPDIRSSSFQRPRSERNIASGIPKFFPLSMIQQGNNPYVRDDTMFIKVIIDFRDLPSSMLRYQFGLNEGIPPYIRDDKVQRELQRRRNNMEAQNEYVNTMMLLTYRR